MGKSDFLETIAALKLKLVFAETVGPFGTKAHIKKFKGEWE